MDLIASLVYTGLVSLLILASGAGTLWALLLVTFVPGYVTVAALFPGHGLQGRLRELLEESEQLVRAARRLGVDGKAYREGLAAAREAAARGKLADAVSLLRESNDRFAESLRARQEGKGRVRMPPSAPPAVGGASIDWTERFALSFATSIALVSLLVLLLNFTPFGIRLESIVGILLLYTMAIGFVAFERRLRLPVGDRLAGGIVTATGVSRPTSPVDRALSILFAASLVFAAIVVAYVVVTPRPRETFTQLFWLDANGTLDETPCGESLPAAQECTVLVVVVNNEAARVPYTLGVEILGVLYVGNETQVLNQTTIGPFQRALDDGQEWREPIPFSVPSPGTYQLWVYLYRDSDFETPYRRAFFPLNVTSPG